MAVFFHGGDGDRATGRRILDGIGQQVIKHDTQALGIRLHDKVIGIQLEMEVARGDSQCLLTHHMLDDLTRFYRLQLQRRLLEFSLAMTQQSLDQVLQVEAVLAQDAHNFPLPPGQRAGNFLGQQIGAFSQRRQWRLQLM